MKPDQADSIEATQLWFVAPRQVEVRRCHLPAPEAQQVLVKTIYSAPSPGTELLVYRGQVPQGMPLDDSIQDLQQSTDYPLRYGYACVGVVQQTGSAVDPGWQGRQVFAFQAHASHFVATPDQLLAVPSDVSAQAATFLPNMETAVNLAQDGRPLLGERVVVLGQGVVGLLLTALLAQYPLTSLTVVEARPERQQLALQMGAHHVLSPAQAAAETLNADLLFEVSGEPEALNLAIQLGGYTSRIVIGSWYGSKSVPISLGGQAHRNRLQLITSQVSSIDPGLSGRWDKSRRFDLAWEMIRRVNPTRLLTQTLALTQAQQLYQQLDAGQGALVQPLFHYQD